MPRTIKITALVKLVGQPDIDPDIVLECAQAGVEAGCQVYQFRGEAIELGKRGPKPTIDDRTRRRILAMKAGGISNVEIARKLNLNRGVVQRTVNSKEPAKTLEMT